jgi:hypothetical protein
MENYATLQAFITFQYIGRLKSDSATLHRTNGEETKVLRLSVGHD